jgi:hypothetical protein
MVVMVEKDVRVNYKDRNKYPYDLMVVDKSDEVVEEEEVVMMGASDEEQ